MKQKSGKKPSRPESFKRKPKFSLDEDAFFESDPKRRRKIVGGGGGDDVIESDDSDEEGGDVSEADGGEGGEEKEQVDTETADEKRYRVAKEYLEKFRYLTKREEEDKEEEEGEEDEEEREGRRDSLVAAILQKEQLEESGRAQRFLASRVQKPEALDEFQVLVRHRLSVTAVALAEDDMRGFSASKDGTIIHWDVETGKKEKYLWPNEDVLVSHGAKSPQNKSTKRSKHVLALAVSSDGRYLTTGGLDRHIHLWDTRTREHIQAFHGHKGPVSCLTFRQGTSQLFSASSDRTIKLWNAEDRCHLDNLFGHQSEVLTIDCLRKERVLTAARDRTMRLWKVPEESQLVYRAPASSLECACFVNNEEFLSGSDDGSIELWSILRKKPVCIVKNAHTMPIVQDQPNGECANEAKSTSSARSWVSSVTACRGSDLAASGAANDVVRLWAIESDTKSIRPLYDLPLVGYINSLAFARSGRFLVAGVGQEPRLGRWGCVPAAQNGVALYSLRHS